MKTLPIIFVVFLFLQWFGVYPALAQEPQCNPESRITETFDNGAQWDFCWESRVRENLVLTDVYYTPPGGSPLRVLGSARLSQLHVAYDDSDITYNDVTQYGLGGGYLISLTEQDCPDGNLVYLQSRAVLCQWREDANTGTHTANHSHKTQSLNLFSVSQVGAYAYIINWTFYANGELQPTVGATGALQRSGDNTQSDFGRILSPDTDTVWLSHTHTYYWRLDFDLGDSAEDDIVRETRYVLNDDGTRTEHVETFTGEQARSIDSDQQTHWTISANGQSASPAYVIEPIRSGHRFERPEIEPYSNFDFFVTVVNDCERFASQNARFNPDCHNNVLQYVDGQSIVKKDIVLWHRVSFHHVPRKEDQRHMHTHWDGFVMQPRNVLKGTDLPKNESNNLPELAHLSRRASKSGDSIHDCVPRFKPSARCLIKQQRPFIRNS